MRHPVELAVIVERVNSCLVRLLYSVAIPFPIMSCQTFHLPVRYIIPWRERRFASSTSGVPVAGREFHEKEFPMSGRNFRTRTRMNRGACRRYCTCFREPSQENKSDSQAPPSPFGRISLAYPVKERTVRPFRNTAVSIERAFRHRHSAERHRERRCDSNPCVTGRCHVRCASC